MKPELTNPEIAAEKLRCWMESHSVRATPREIVECLALLPPHGWQRLCRDGETIERLIAEARRITASVALDNNPKKKAEASQ
jgi:hypothetical protein